MYLATWGISSASKDCGLYYACAYFNSAKHCVCFLNVMLKLTVNILLARSSVSHVYKHGFFGRTLDSGKYTARQQHIRVHVSQNVAATKLSYQCAATV